MTFNTIIKHCATRCLSLLRRTQASMAMLFVLALAGCSVQSVNVDLKTLDGKTFTASEQKGKVVLVNFWATSCSTCIEEMPDMVHTYQKFKNQSTFQMFAVAMSYDVEDYVKSYAQTRELPFHVVWDKEDKAAQAYGGVKLTPTTFVMNKKGEVVKRYVGKPNFNELHQLIETEMSK